MRHHLQPRADDGCDRTSNWVGLELTPAWLLCLRSPTLLAMSTNTHHNHEYKRCETSVRL